MKNNKNFRSYLDVGSVGAEDTHDHEEHEDCVITARGADCPHHEALVLVEEHRAAVLRFQGRWLWE